MHIDIYIVEDIRRRISYNFRNILNELQISLAKETLTKCIGNVDAVHEMILPKNGKRRERMTRFLKFILQEDYNVIEFEKIVNSNGLEELLQNRETIFKEPQDIGIL